MKNYASIQNANIAYHLRSSYPFDIRFSALVNTLDSSYNMTVNFGTKWEQFSMTVGLFRLHVAGVK